jgi:hypothetical protein
MVEPTIFSTSIIPHPHFEFIDNQSNMINYAFAFVLGGSIGLILFLLISETYNYLND